MSGISATHGAHQVAHRFMKMVLPFNEDKENLIAAWKAYKLEAAKQLNVNLRDDMAQSALTGLVANPNSFDPTEKDTESEYRYIAQQAYQMADHMLTTRTENP